MKRILVTGGLGYIGSHTVVELLNQNYEVVIIDNLSNSDLNVLDRLEQITGKRPDLYTIDLNETSKLIDIIKSERIEGVIHFAAFLLVNESVEKPLHYFRNNIGGMISLLTAMDACSIRPLVFSSSCTVYGDTDASPITEDQPIAKAASPYGTTKIICEQMLEDACRYKDIKGLSLRYFNPIGAHESALIGEKPIGVPTHLVPYITQTAKGIREQLTIFGNDYPTPDGTNIRDYIHVVDLAEAHIKALEYAMNHEFSYEVVNLGTGKGTSVLEMVLSFEKVTGLKLNYQFGPRRSGDVIQIWADTTKAKQLLHWEAKRGIDEMLLSAWNWEETDYHQ